MALEKLIPGKNSIYSFLDTNKNTPLYIVNKEGSIVFKLISYSLNNVTIHTFDDKDEELEDVSKNTFKLKSILDDPKFIHDGDEAYTVTGIKNFLGPESASE